MNAIETIKRFLQAENKRDWMVWASFLTDDVEYQVIGSATRARGKQDYLSKMRAIYWELPDWKFKTTNIQGNSRVVFAEFDGCGHFTGEYDGRQFHCVPLKLRAVCVFEMRGGRIQRVREYFDAEGYRRQLIASSD